LTTSALQAPKPSPLENLGWTALSITAAAVLLPAIGIKALSRAVFPKPAADVEERHYLIQ